MPRRPRKPCTIPGCPELTPNGGRCKAHEREADKARGSSSERGYDTRWARIRRAYLYAHPWCVLCARQAVVADHWPKSRKQLVAEGVTNPDAPSRLRPLCTSCHSKETARNQPGGWAAAQAKPERPPF